MRAKGMRTPIIVAKCEILWASHRGWAPKAVGSTHEIRRQRNARVSSGNSVGLEALRLSKATKTETFPPLRKALTSDVSSFKGAGFNAYALAENEVGHWSRASVDYGKSVAFE